jgi:hypothetical protein
MAIVFFCPNCNSRFDATIRMRGIEYTCEGQKYKIDDDEDVCDYCLNEVEEAKKIALQKRKKI